MSKQRPISIIVQDMTQYDDKETGFNPASFHKFDRFGEAMRFLRQDINMTDSQIDLLLDKNVVRVLEDGPGSGFFLVSMPPEIN